MVKELYKRKRNSRKIGSWQWGEGGVREDQVNISKTNDRLELYLCNMEKFCTLFLGATYPSPNWTPF